MSNKMGLEAAIEATVEFLNKAVKPVLVGGPNCVWQRQERHLWIW